MVVIHRGGFATLYHACLRAGRHWLACAFELNFLQAHEGFG